MLLCSLSSYSAFNARKFGTKIQKTRHIIYSTGFFISSTGMINISVPGRVNKTYCTAISIFSVRFCCHFVPLLIFCHTNEGRVFRAIFHFIHSAADFFFSSMEIFNKISNEILLTLRESLQRQVVRMKTEHTAQRTKRPSNLKACAFSRFLHGNFSFKIM